MDKKLSSDSIAEIENLMRKGDTASIEKIMDKFIVADKNLILKTDIENSKNFTLLLAIRDDLKIKGLKKSAKTLTNFCDWYIKVRVSDKRKSWSMILDAISAVKREQSSSTIGAKLLGMDKKSDT